MPTANLWMSTLHLIQHYVTVLFQMPTVDVTVHCTYALQSLAIDGITDNAILKNVTVITMRSPSHLDAAQPVPPSRKAASHRFVARYL